MKQCKVLYYLAFVTLFVACSSNNDGKVADQPDTFNGVVLGEDITRIGMPEKLDYLINNLSLSDEMIGILAHSDKTLFDASLLNSSDNVKFYSTSKSKAVNMGVYGAELNYLIHFDQTEYSMKYMLASKLLADQIGVAMAFDQDAVKEYESNVENKDSLINIIFTVYGNARRMLKNEEQFMLSSLVIVGSWVENMYVTTEFFGRTKSTKTKSELVTKIIEQKEYLAKIIETVEILDEGDNVFISDIIKKLHAIQTVYDGFGDRLLSEADVKELNKALTAARNRIVKVN